MPHVLGLIYVNRLVFWGSGKWRWHLYLFYIQIDTKKPYCLSEDTFAAEMCDVFTPSAGGGCKVTEVLPLSQHSEDHQVSATVLFI